MASTREGQGKGKGRRTQYPVKAAVSPSSCDRRESWPIAKYKWWLSQWQSAGLLQESNLCQSLAKHGGDVHHVARAEEASVELHKWPQDSPPAQRSNAYRLTHHLSIDGAYVTKLPAQEINDCAALWHQYVQMGRALRMFESFSHV